MTSFDTWTGRYSEGSGYYLDPLEIEIESSPQFGEFACFLTAEWPQNKEDIIILLG